MGWRARILLMSAMALVAAAVGACADPVERSVTGVTAPPVLRPATTTSTTTTSTTEATTTEAPTTMPAPTTTYPQPDSGPPSSIESIYSRGSGKRPRIPCEPGPDLGQLVQGANCRHVRVEGAIREYVVYVPASVDRSVPAPLVVFLHGDDSNGDDDLRTTGWRSKAEEDGIVLAFPTSLEYNVRTEDPPAWYFKWAGLELENNIVLSQRVQGYPVTASMPADDVGFIETMIDDIEYQWPIDPTRVFAAGFQSGADLALRLALQAPDTFRAIGMSSGGTGSPGHELPKPTRSVPMLLLVGTLDVAYAERSTDDEDADGVPLESDEFLLSPVGTFIVERLAPVTGLDVTTPVRDDKPQHVTTISFGGLGIGGGVARLDIKVIQGLKEEYPMGKNNQAEVGGSALFWNFFEDVVEDASEEA